MIATNYRALFLFAGLGGGALGFARARASGARFEIGGAVDVEDWEQHAHAVVAEGTVRNTWGSVADPRPGYESRNGHHVQDWAASAKTVIGHDPRGLKGAAVADPRLPNRFHGEHGVDGWETPAGTVLGAATTSKGHNVADPRLTARSGRHESKYRVEANDAPAHTVTGSDRIGSGAPSVADPRLACAPRATVLGVVDGASPAGTVLGSASHDNGAFSVADPRVHSERNEGGHGVLRWDRPSPCLIGHATMHNWPAQVADPRGAGFQVGRVVETPDGLVVEGVDLDLDDSRPVECPPIILALDGTWHRPMTTLELAALQALPVQRDDGAWLKLDGRSSAGWRERIGNAVPVATAEAIATTALTCLLSSDAGALTFGSEPVWVGPQRDEGAHA